MFEFYDMNTCDSVGDGSTTESSICWIHWVIKPK